MNTDTRRQILDQNFQAMRLHGFQGVRADKVVAGMGITKGALYHYFPSKLDLGYAIVDELIFPAFTSAWRPMETARRQHLDVLVQILETLKKNTGPDEVRLGCPLNNLLQEMSPLDEGFRLRLGAVLATMARSIETGLAQGQAAGQVRPDASPQALSFFILACVEGSFSIAKSHRSKPAFDASIDQLIAFVQTLRA